MSILKLNWLLLVILAVFVLFIVRGLKRGLIRMHISLLVLALLLLFSTCANRKVSTFLKDNTTLYKVTEKSSSSMVDDELDDTEANPSLGTRVDLIQKLSLPATIKSGLLTNNNEGGYEKFEANQFSEYLSSYMSHLSFNTITFLAVFILGFFIVNGILSATGILNKLPVVGKMNQLGGAALGLIEALVWIGLFFMLVTIFSDTYIGGIAMDGIKASSEVSWIYNHNVLWYIIEAVLIV